jgi:hypothetical protein
MKWLYRFLLSLYPRHVREVFGDEMQAVFADGLEESRIQGILRTGQFVFTEFASVIAGAARAWVLNDGSDFAIPDKIRRGLPRDVFEAENRTAVNLSRMVSAISRGQFERARFYSNQERRSRRELSELREKYGLDE